MSIKHFSSSKLGSVPVRWDNAWSTVYTSILFSSLFIFLPHQMPREYFRAALDGVVKGSVMGGALDLGVDVHLHAQQKDDTLQVLIQHCQMQEVLAPGIHLKMQGVWSLGSQSSILTCSAAFGSRFRIALPTSSSLAAMALAKGVWPTLSLTVRSRSSCERRTAEHWVCLQLMETWRALWPMESCSKGEGRGGAQDSKGVP